MIALTFMHVDGAFVYEQWRARQVDFANQKVLIFAWYGSGGDDLTYSTDRTYAENIVFKYKPGRSRDLRAHLHIYVLRSNVTWDF